MILSVLVYLAPSFSFQALVRRLESNPGAYEKLIAGGHLKKGPITRWLAANGVQAKYDDKRRRQTPGLFAAETGIRVKGANGFVVLLGQAVTGKEGWWYGPGRLVFVHLVGGKVRADLLPFVKHSAESDMEGTELCAQTLPQDAIYYKGTLSIGGLQAWTGNGARTSMEWYRYSNSDWQLKGRLVTEDECWGAETTLGIRNGRLQPVDLVSRTYPPHLSSCHATACFSHRERWLFSGNAWKLVGKRRRNTAFNTLDKLYVAITRGDRKTIQAYSSDVKVATHLAALRRRANEEPRVDFPTVNSIEGTVIGLANLKSMFHFRLKNNRWVVSRIEPYAPQ